MVKRLARENWVVLVYTDNQTSVDVWATGTCTDKRIMAIVRALFFHTAGLNINLVWCTLRVN